MRGVSTSPRSSSRSPAPSLPRGQAHSSLPTPTARGPNTGRGPALLPARCQPQPSPSCPSWHDAGTAGICLLQNTWPWHSLARSGVGAGSWGEVGMATLWGPSGPVPKAQTGTGTSWPRKGTSCSGRGHSRGHQPQVLQSHSSCLLPFCAVFAAPCACAPSWGSPGTLKVQEQCVCPRAAWSPYLSNQQVPAWQGDRETSAGTALGLQL